MLALPRLLFQSKLTTLTLLLLMLLKIMTSKPLLESPSHLETPKFSLNVNPGPFYMSPKRIIVEPLKISPIFSLISSLNIHYSAAFLPSVSSSTSLSKSPSSLMIISVNDWNFVRNVRTEWLMIGGGLFGQINTRLKLASKLGQFGSSGLKRKGSMTTVSCLPWREIELLSWCEVVSMITSLALCLLSQREALT